MQSKTLLHVYFLIVHGIRSKSSAVAAIGSTARKVVSLVSSNGYTFKIMECSAVEPKITQSTLM